MKRSKSRESAFLIIFEKTFNDVSIDEIIEAAKLTRELETDDFTLHLVNGVYENLETIDEIIQQNAIGWDISRISKISLTALRLSIYELFHEKDCVPKNVSINEAIELTKKYSTKDDSSFVNGILSTIAKGLDAQSE